MRTDEMQLDPAAQSAGYRLVALGNTGSTNSEALGEARGGGRGPVWFVAESQSAGRGRRGNSWLSPPGNLYATLLLTEPSPVECASQLSFVAALAVHDAIAECAPGLESSIGFKWPNDILIGDAKVAGLLLESENMPGLSVAIGIGVNCRHYPDSVSYPATSLEAAGAPVPPSRLFAALTAAMHRRVSLWQSGTNFPVVRRDWLARAAGLGEDIHVRLPDREIHGRFMGLDEHGRLLVQPEHGPHEKIAAGEVFAFGAVTR